MRRLTGRRAARVRAHRRGVSKEAASVVRGVRVVSARRAGSKTARLATSGRRAALAVNAASAHRVGLRIGRVVASVRLVALAVNAHRAVLRIARAAPTVRPAASKTVLVTA
ncbi:hypothetical protein, partial [Paraburkholderia caledonica]|uniref:hypothetical protein n=1 Tax=Paraburkholderia caledonica TaxID=134536 RepID=UPI0038B7141C